MKLKPFVFLEKFLEIVYFVMNFTIIFQHVINDDFFFFFLMHRLFDEFLVPRLQPFVKYICKYMYTLNEIFKCLRNAQKGKID